VTVLGMILAEGRWLAGEQAAAGVVNWLDLPPKPGSHGRPQDPAGSQPVPDRAKPGVQRRVRGPDGRGQRSRRLGDAAKGTGVPSTDAPAPTTEHIARHSPVL